MDGGSVLDSGLLMDEGTIVEEAKTDDRAFEVLYNHYFPRVYGYVIKRVGHAEVAEDLVSAVFLKIFTNLEGYQPGKHACSFAAWVFRIATNALIDHYRKQGRVPKSVDVEEVDLADDSLNVEQNAILSAEREVVQKAIVELPEKYQKILQLKYFSELSNIEIAEVMEISPNNTGVLLHRALKQFQKCYEQYV